MSLVPRGKRGRTTRSIAALIVLLLLGIFSASSALGAPTPARSNQVALPAAKTQLAPNAAKAAIPITDGPGYNVPPGARLYAKTHYTHEHNGAYLQPINGVNVNVYCAAYEEGLDIGQLFSLTSGAAGYSTPLKEEIAYAINRYGSTTSNDLAAAVSIAINLLINPSTNSDYRYDWDHTYIQWYRAHHPAVIHAASLIQSYAATNHGPYKATGKVSTTQVLPGSSFTASFTVTSASGYGVEASTSFNLSGARITSTLPKTTNSHGVTTVSVLRTGLSTASVALTASATALTNSSSLLVSLPGRGQQLLFSAGPKAATASASVSVGISPTTPYFSWECTGNCDGNPLTTSGFSNSSGSEAALHVFDNGKLVKIAYMPSDDTVWLNVNIRDGHEVTEAVNYYIDGHWTPLYAWSHVWTVDCPPLPKPTLSGLCSCTNAVVTFGLPLNTTTHEESLSLLVNGTVYNTVYAEPGQTVAIPYTVVANSSNKLSLVSGIKQASGAWHIGTVVLP